MGSKIESGSPADFSEESKPDIKNDIPEIDIPTIDIEEETKPEDLPF
jgi:hypothetical protein